MIEASGRDCGDSKALPPAASSLTSEGMPQIPLDLSENGERAFPDRRNEFQLVSFSIVSTCRGNNTTAAEVEEPVAGCSRLKQVDGECGPCFLIST